MSEFFPVRLDHHAGVFEFCTAIVTSIHIHTASLHSKYCIHQSTEYRDCRECEYLNICTLSICIKSVFFHGIHLFIATVLYSFKLQLHSSVSIKTSIASVPHVSTTSNSSPSMLMIVPFGNHLHATWPYRRYLPLDDSCPLPSLQAQQ